VDEHEIRQRLSKYSFYHTIRVSETVSTAGMPEAVPLVNLTLPVLRGLDLPGKRVLDIGCRDGLFCFEAEKMGAGEVIGIDNDPSLGALEFLIPFFQSNVKMYELNVYELRPATFGTFDLVLFPGVLYHLRHPFWALKQIAGVLKEGGQLLLETAVLVDDNRHAMLFCPTGADSPYEPTSCSFFNTKGLVDTLRSFGLPMMTFKYLWDAHMRPASNDRQVVVDRVVMVCQSAPWVIDESVARYWFGTHRIHSAQHEDIYAGEQTKPADSVSASSPAKL
jgi:2-polyprenyl-3-methyl-5-hydroxy-6-metoxy-1,4-benzoquinol methylase